MKHQYQKKMNDNHRSAGFTLVEVLIAMAILALIAAPLLHMFITAARTNAKARKIMQSTTIAQNIMEEIKAYSLEDIAKEMNHAASTSKLSQLSSVSAHCFEAYKDASDPQILKKVDECSVTIGGATVTGVNPASVTTVYETVSGAPVVKEVKFTGQSKEVGGKTVSEYSFVMGDLHVANSPNTYDAVITMTADPSTAIANISSMNRPECAYYVQQSSEMNQIVTEFWKRHQNYTGTNLGAEEDETIVKSSLADLVTRNMTVDYDGDSVTVSYVFNCTDSTLTAAADRTQEKSLIIYNSFVNDTELESIYVYYYPLYATPTTPIRDHVTINNSSGKNVTVYLIKMVDVGTYSVANEQNYRVNLNVNDLDGANAATEQLTQVCANILEGNFNLVDFNTVTSTDEKSLIKDLGNSSNQYVKYSVVIDVYEHKDASFSTADTFNATSVLKYTSFTGSTVDNSKIED